MRRTAIALPLAAVLVLAGCAGEAAPQSSYDPSTAQSLQTQVYAVTDLAARADHAGARAKLDELDAAAQAALSAGTIDQARFDGIALAIAQLRSRLDGLLAEAAQRALEEQQAALEAELQQKQQELEEQQARIEEQNRQQQTQRDEEENSDEPEESPSPSQSNGNGNGNGNGNSGNGNSGNGNGNGNNDEEDEEE